ncbi:MAG: hypothetical protein IJ060_06515 [Oscillospiraceae bacterium]|nr:hypothetical protein [Oscillospiraceae bacterium]
MNEDSLLRRAGGGFLSFFPHLLMTYSWMLLTFYVINIFNPAMFFLTSKISQKFELVYAGVTLICAGTVFLRKSLYRKYDTLPARFGSTTLRLMKKSLRILAVIAAAAVIAFAVPAFRALSSGNRDHIETAYFRTMALVSGIVTLVFSIVNITVQHHQVKAEYLAAQKKQ